MNKIYAAHELSAAVHRELGSSNIDSLDTSFRSEKRSSCGATEAVLLDDEVLNRNVVLGT